MQFYEYLQAYEDYFWSWEEHTEVAALPNGSTIAYRDYLVEVMELLADQGLPPFGALLLALIATNKTMEDGIARVEDFIREKKQRYDGESPEDVIKFLRILEQLPPDCKEGKKRIQVLQVLFENAHNGIGPKSSRDIATDTKRLIQHHTSNLREKLDRKRPFNRAIFQKDLRAIELLHRRFTGTVDILNAMAGLPQLDDEVLQIEKKEAAEGERFFSKDFVEELLADYKTFQVGALIRRIWSGMNIPFHHTVPSQQPLGGVSDLSNKGDFDKLLISEFANDDLVLMSRLANNEALYLQREIPPSNNDEERILLLDVSIRNWGTPKIMAYAIALAIARHPKTDIACRIFGVGSICSPIMADNISQLINSLMLVSEGLHAAAGLEDFFTNHAGKKKSEVFFISTSGAMAYPAVQKVINDHYAWFKYWINVEQDGSIELYRNQHNSKKFIQHIQLPLEELWAKPANKQTKETELAEDLPSIYPILFPQPGKWKKLLSAGEGRDFLIDSERRVFRFYARNYKLSSKGLELIVEGLPSGSTDFAVGEDTNCDFLLLCYKRQTKEITVINLTTKEQSTLNFDAVRISSTSFNDFFFFENTFCYRTWNGYWTINHSAINGNGVKWYDAIPDEIAEACAEVGAAEKRIAGESAEYGSLLKNITKVYISQAGNLVLGKHHLMINSNVIKLVLVNNDLGKNALHAEEKVTGREFVFPCGSTVTINRSGMLLLTSSAPAGLGKYDILLEHAGPNKIQTIKELRTFTDYDLKLCKEKVDITPSLITVSLNEYEAELKAAQLTTNGAAARVVPATTSRIIYIPLVLEKGLGVASDTEFAGNSLYYADAAAKPLTVIPPAKFYEKYILSFIHYIKQHDA
jgi:ribosomal protein L7/L12